MKMVNKKESSFCGRGAKGRMKKNILRFKSLVYWKNFLKSESSALQLFHSYI